MIGYYIHHVGRGHLHRALSIAEQLPEQVTALSSLPPVPDWSGRWVQLPRDDDAATVLDPTANGTLHWAPLGDAGLRGRMAAIAGWIAAARPRLIVVDLSVEVAVLARLFGVPVVVVTLPGVRDDPAHAIGHQLAQAVLAPWPAGMACLSPSLEALGNRLFHTGAISRFDGRIPSLLTPGRSRRAVVLAGTGGTSCRARPSPADVPGWSVDFVGGSGWVDDPWPLLCTADVVVTHAGLGALADVAAARRPAVILPEPRPHDEQITTAAALSAAGIAVVLEEDPSPAAWPGLLDSALRLGGSGWAAWSFGDGAARASAVLQGTRECVT